MVKLSIKNFKNEERKILSWIDKAAQEAADVSRGLAVVGFKQILDRSAQRSGDFVGNWQFSVNSINYEFKNLGLLEYSFDPDSWYIMGDQPAIKYAISNNKGRDANYKLGDTFYISNSASSEDDNYAIRIEQGQMRFRPGNDGMPVAYTSRYMDLWYPTIDKTMANILKLERI